MEETVLETLNSELPCRTSSTASEKRLRGESLWWPIPSLTAICTGSGRGEKLVHILVLGWPVERGPSTNPKKVL